ncbi:MAG: non-ribosomal peptide synthetase, partial [bacterium]|nr:non-ribosomal peptide synthetase [bacterium]
GRIDHQVKIRGYRIELGEIEARLLTHPEIKEAVVITRQTGDGDNILCANYVAEDTKEPATGIRSYLTQYLPGYMIPSYFIKLEKIPLTTNGKIDRKALSQQPITKSKQQTHTPPRNNTEKKLSEIWAHVLTTQKQEIGIDDNFFEIGGHSLRATIMVAKIHKEFNVKLPLTEIFKKPSIRAMAETITEFARDKYAAIEPAEKKEYYILSSAQQRLFVLQQMEQQSTAYNMPQIIPLTKETRHIKLEKVFKQLIRRHESLRTSFQMVKENPVQIIHDEVEFEIEYYKPAAGLREIGKTFFRTFRMTKAPLLRVGIIEATGKEGPLQDGLMMLDMHHILTDATSMKVLTKEFFAMATGQSVPP